MNDEIIRNIEEDKKLHKAIKNALIENEFEEMTSEEEVTFEKLERMLKKIQTLGDSPVDKP